MTCRRDPEADIVQFFLTAPPASVLTMFRICRGLIASRGLVANADAATSAKPARMRRMPERLREKVADPAVS